MGGQGLSIDYGRYADTNKSDVLVTNGHVEFEAHKAILSACSGMFRDIIEGDSTLEKIPVSCSDEALKFTQEMIYAEPKDRSKTEELRYEHFQIEMVEIV